MYRYHFCITVSLLTETFKVYFIKMCYQTCAELYHSCVHNYALLVATV